jgi:hypothetical protein
MLPWSAYNQLERRELIVEAKHSFDKECQAERLFDLVSFLAVLDDPESKK